MSEEKMRLSCCPVNKPEAPEDTRARARTVLSHKSASAVAGKTAWAWPPIRICWAAALQPGLLTQPGGERDVGRAEGKAGGPQKDLSPAPLPHLVPLLQPFSRSGVGRAAAATKWPLQMRALPQRAAAD